MSTELASCSRKAGKLRRTFCAFAALAAVSLSGCQTSEVLGSADDAEVSQGLTLPGDEDLAKGKAHFVKGNYGLAETHFRKAVELRPGDGEAWLGLAASYDRLGRFDLADRAYEALLRIEGRLPRIVNNMGYSQLLRGNRDKARKLFLEAKRKMPDDPVIAANIKELEEG